MAEILAEKWMKGVAITTTILAVLTSIASSRAGFCVSKSQVLTAQSGSQWAFYQAKSIKQNLLETQRRLFEVDILGSTTEGQKDFLQKNLQEAESQVARYDQEKSDIMLSSVGALLKRKEMWIVGLIFGCIALVYLANGFLLFF